MDYFLAELICPGVTHSTIVSRAPLAAEMIFFVCVSCMTICGNTPATKRFCDFQQNGPRITQARGVRFLTCHKLPFTGGFAQRKPLFLST